MTAPLLLLTLGLLGGLPVNVGHAPRLSLLPQRLSLSATSTALKPQLPGLLLAQAVAPTTAAEAAPEPSRLAEFAWTFGALTAFDLITSAPVNLIAYAAWDAEDDDLALAAGALSLVVLVTHIVVDPLLAATVAWWRAGAAMDTRSFLGAWLGGIGGMLAGGALRFAVNLVAGSIAVASYQASLPVYLLGGVLWNVGTAGGAVLLNHALGSAPEPTTTTPAAPTAPGGPYPITALPPVRSAPLLSLRF